MPPSLTDSGAAALDLLKRLLDEGVWYNSAIELVGDIDGEDAFVEAAHILQAAGVTLDQDTLNCVARLESQRAPTHPVNPTTK